MRKGQIGQTEVIHPVAAYKGHAEVARILISAGANVNYQRPGELAPPLVYAAENGHLELVRLLLRHGIASNQSFSAVRACA